MKNTDYLDLSKGLNGFEGLVPSFGKNMGEKYMTGRRKGATDYLEVIDCEAVKDYIEKEVETPKYDGITVTFDGLISEKALEPEPGPEPELSSFTINGVLYNFNTGMSWEDWVASKYNTCRAIIKRGLPYIYCGLDVIHDDSMDVTHYEITSNKIEENGSYTLGDVVPIIPMANMYGILFSLLPQSPYYNENIASKLMESPIFEHVYDGYGIMPNTILNFSASDVEKFFANIDEHGVAQANHVFVHPTAESLDDPYVLKFMELLKLDVSDFYELVRTNEIYVYSLSPDAVRTGMFYLLNLTSHSCDNELAADLNSDTMHFYNNLNDCIRDFPNSAISDVYYDIEDNARVRGIFVLTIPKTGSDADSLLAGMVVAFVTDEYTAFLFIIEGK